MSKTIITAGPFDNIAGKHILFLHEIAKLGELNVLLFTDDLIASVTGNAPKFPLAERRYYVESIRYVKQVYTVSDLSQLQKVSQILGKDADIYCAIESEACSKCRQGCQNQNIEFITIPDDTLTDYPPQQAIDTASNDKKVIVTGCFDWFHTGHVRFFEEASEYGDVYVGIGNDKNLELLKGPGHPMFKQDQRRFIAASIKFVKQAFVSSGDGWLDADPEIQIIKPDRYVVNEDGSKDSKSDYCKKNKIEYIVLERNPKQGLKRRTSTNLRGF